MHKESNVHGTILQNVHLSRSSLYTLHVGCLISKPVPNLIIRFGANGTRFALNTLPGVGHHDGC